MAIVTTRFTLLPADLRGLRDARTSAPAPPPVAAMLRYCLRTRGVVVGDAPRIEAGDADDERRIVDGMVDIRVRMDERTHRIELTWTLTDDEEERLLQETRHPRKRVRAMGGAF